MSNHYSDAFKAGKNAYEEGIVWGENPYHMGTEEFCCWGEGWQEAQAANVHPGQQCQKDWERYILSQSFSNLDRFPTELARYRAVFNYAWRKGVEHGS